MQPLNQGADDLASLMDSFRSIFRYSVRPPNPMMSEAPVYPFLFFVCCMQEDRVDGSRLYSSRSEACMRQDITSMSPQYMQYMLSLETGIR